MANSNVDDFVSYAPAGTITALTSPAGTGHLNGSWASFSAGTVVVDMDKLFAQGAFERPNLVKHAGGWVALLSIAGGTTTNPAGAYAHSPSLRNMSSVLTNAVTGLTSGEVCRANHYNLGAPLNQITSAFTCGI
jgi:hypothetical protein